MARSYGIDLKHLGRKLTIQDFEEFDYIMAMDQNNFQDIKALQGKNPSGKAKVFMFRDFDPDGKGDVPDPYYGTMDDFEEVYKMCERTSEPLLEFILKNKS
jgi:protein-tyrosine phosphatase